MALKESSVLRSFIVVYKAMLGGQVLFAAIAFYLVWSKTVPPTLDADTERIFQVVALLLGVAGFFGGTFIMRKKILQARELSGSVQEKFSIHRAAAILQWAMLEGPVLFCIVCFFLSANYAFLALAGVLIICFGMLAPTRSRVAFQLNLSDAEALEL